VFFERDGLVYRSDRTFRDDEHVLLVIQRILRPLGRRVDQLEPMIDARLLDGSRVNAAIPPAARHGPSLTIRKFSRNIPSGADLVRLGALTLDSLQFLAACVRARLNILVSGGTGTGKTTLLSLLADFIPPTERVITIEDPAELQIKHEDWISLETRPASIEGKGQIVQRDLLKNALRMRPDRIILGECRAGEAFDMLQAMNTGHDGSLTTVHANTPRDALARVENMVLMAGLDLPIQAVREQIASSIHLIVQLSRFRDGSRRITQITEICGIQEAAILMQDIFELRSNDRGRNGELVATGLRPRCINRLNEAGEHLTPEIFGFPDDIMAISSGSGGRR
jgi:pilus assembly protein CpaF